MKASLQQPREPGADAGSRFSFVTTHALVLTALAEEPGARVCDLARQVGVSERRVQDVIAELEASAYVSRRRVGRRNQYLVDLQKPMRERTLTSAVDALIAALCGRSDGQR